MSEKKTAKEKAFSLIEKFTPLVKTWDCYHDAPRYDEDIIKDAKQCALITVNEIIETDVLIDEDTYVEKPSYLEYWKQVKKELENI